MKVSVNSSLVLPFKARSSGLTLVETVVGTAILGIVLTSVFMMFATGMYIMDQSRNTAHAGHILQSEMENMRRMNWVNFVDYSSNPEFEIDSRFTEELGDRFTGERRVRPVTPELYEVLVTVSWTSRRGEESSRSYFTLIGKEGLNDYYYRAF